MAQHERRGYRALRKGRISLPGHYYLVTTVTHERQRWFTDFSHGCVVAREIHALDNAGLVKSLAWVLMPDHLHWLLRIDHVSLSEVMARLKGRTAYMINCRTGDRGSVWQPGFHDHGLRRDEDLLAAARYIVANPIRAGIVDSVKRYPFWDAVWLTERGPRELGSKV